MFFRFCERDVTAHNENRSSHVNIQNGEKYNTLNVNEIQVKSD